MAKGGMTGSSAMSGRIRHVIGGLKPGAAAAIYTEAEIEMAEAKRRTPVADGHLRKSGEVTPPVIVGNDVSVGLVFGGPSAPYAIYVHEDLDAFHTVGQAKFLESTLRESKPFMGQRIARRMHFEGARR